MADIPSTIPQQIRAGDTARWRRNLGNYPADDGWQLTYAVVGPTAVHSVAATPDGAAHKVEVLASASAAWEPGIYRVQEYVAKGVDRYTLSVVSLRVLPDLAASNGLDTRTHARKVLDAIEAWLERKAPTAASFQYEGRRLENYPLPELLALRDRYRAEVRSEDAADSGLGGRRMLVRV